MKAITSAFLLFFSIPFYSCKSKNVFTNNLNADALTSQIFSVNKNRDTTLVTKSGIIVQLKKESLESDSTNIKLEIKEALTNEAMVLAGLSTMSGKQALSSAGMLYINAAAGYTVSIKKEIEVLVPTKKYNADMSVFKGKEVDGKINWVEPQPLPNDTLQRQIKIGEQIFKANCSNCHKIDSDYTGPSIASSASIYTKNWIYAFVKNPAGMIAKNREAQVLFQKWKPTVMTAFPNLTHYEIDAILAYADAKSKRKFFPTTLIDYNAACDDSCSKYLDALYKLEDDRYNLEVEKEIDNTDFFTLDRIIPIPPQNTTPIQPQITTPSQPKTINEKIKPTKRKVNITSAFESRPEKEKVNQENITATFYTINIKTFGWVNIDLLLKDYNNCISSELFVRLQAKYETNFSVNLIIPSLKVFVEGGKLKDGTLYGFDETNGKIPLPQNAPCYILAFGEVDGKLIFGKANFIASTKQTIDLTITETTKEGLANEIKALKLDGVDTEIKESEIGKKQIALTKTATEIEKLKPKNCDCELQNMPRGDTTAKVVMLYKK